MAKSSSSAAIGKLDLAAGRLAAPGVIVGLALATVTLLALMLRLYDLDTASLWSDEAFSGHWIHRSLAYLWTDGLVIETTPPLYYMLLKIWAALVGDGDFQLRLFSALASAATVPLIFLIGFEMAGAMVGLAAALIFALAPMQIAYAQEARVYSLVPLFYGLALLGLFRFVRAALAETPRRRSDDMALALYAVGAVLLIYAHATSVFTVAALCLCAGGLLLARRGRWALPRFILANAVVAVLSVPQLYAILQQAGRFDMTWVQKPDLIGLLNLVTHLLVDPVTPLTLFRVSCIIALAAALMLAITSAWLRPGRLVGTLLVGVPAIFLVAVIAVSYISPFLIPRIIIWIGLPVALLAAMALLGPAPRLVRAGFALALVVCIGVGLQGVYLRTPGSKEDWRGLMASLLPQLGPEDMLVIGPETSILPMLRYAGGAFDDNGREIFRWEPRPRQPDLYVPAHIQPPIAVDNAALSEAARQGRRIWLLMRSSDWQQNVEAAAKLDPPPVVDRSHPMLVQMRW
ncbi:glycosyltransferase family 39 protein [Belnapia sp. T6]|uniref:Glycosyltransferase family 39 protein n=1 Tax=Belnapia mucosa TaxID=2804532 RepID=A0ABS1UZX1_9PROT|nr:glycosyltransferase family 39 protein [Belnapia mucosa]MBL6455012.1 glycosyltransferase family 39 protein [Belnapia mucosa]